MVGDAQSRRFRLTVNAGAFERHDSIVCVPMGLPASAAVDVCEETIGAGAIPAQVDAAGDLTFVLSGTTPAGITRRFAGEVRSVGSVDSRVSVRVHPALVAITHDGRTIAHYNFLSVWKPYFSPLLGPTGNVVRGASAEHQHQAGLFFSYGGHFTPSNIWSDWDEPIYGPDGKMLHQGFDIVAGGPVFALIRQRVGYIAADGSHLLDEYRDLRLYPLASGVTILDLVRTCESPKEASMGPFGFSCRVADILRTVDMSRRGPPPERTMQPTEMPGKMQNSAGETSQSETISSQRWLDRSGALPDGWGGLAFFDNPANPGYPGRLGAAGYGTMGLSYDYPAGSPVTTWRYRVYTHTGDAVEAGIEARWRDYAHPVEVVVD